MTRQKSSPRLLCGAWLYLLSACGPASGERTPDSLVATRPDTVRPNVSGCDSAVTQLEINSCGTEALIAADKREATAIAEAREIVRATSFSALSQLEEGEAAWKAYRDAHCASVSAKYLNGSLAPRISADCRTRLADERRDELQRAFARDPR